MNDEKLPTDETTPSNTNENAGMYGQWGKSTDHATRIGEVKQDFRDGTQKFKENVSKQLEEGAGDKAANAISKVLAAIAMAPFNAITSIIVRMMVTPDKNGTVTKMLIANVVVAVLVVLVAFVKHNLGLLILLVAPILMSIIVIIYASVYDSSKLFYEIDRTIKTKQVRKPVQVKKGSAEEEELYL